MADMPNYGLLNTMANGIREGMNAYETSRNAKRSADLQNLVMGVQNTDQGLTYTPQKQAEIDQTKEMQGLLRQRQIDEQAPNSELSQRAQGIAKSNGVSGVDNVAYADLKDIGMPLAEAHMKGLGSQGLIDNKNDNLAFQKHKTAVDQVQNDKPTQQLLTGFQNLKNAKTNFEQGGATPQDFAELQQAVRANLGIKGQSGVGERDATNLKSLGINIDNMNQFLTGNTKSVLESDPAFAKQIMGLVDLETANKAQQASQQIGKKRGAFASFYNTPAGQAWKPDFDNTVASQYKQFGLDENGKPIKQASDDVKYDPDVVKYASDHKISLDQAKAVKINRTIQGAPAATPAQNNDSNVGGFLKNLGFGG